MRQNKLYTVNRGNRYALTNRYNLFNTGGQRRRPTNSLPDSMPILAKPDTPMAPTPLISIPGAAATLYFANYATNKLSNPWSFKESFSKEGLKSGMNAAAGSALSAGAGIVGGLTNSAISGGLESGAGSAISGIGSTVGSAVGAVNPVLGAAIDVGSQLIGGLTNKMFGTKVDQAKLNEINKNINMLNSFTSNASSFDDIQGPVSVSTDTNAYSGGWFSSGKARRKNAELREKLALAKTFALRSVDNNIGNVSTEQLNDALANYSAFGGYLDGIDPSTAIGYSLYTDKFVKDKLKNDSGMTNMFAGTPSTMFADGGNIPNRTVLPLDNTRVVTPIILPIERQQNFSDLQYFWNAGREYPVGLWKHKDGTFHTTGAYGKDIQLTLEEADAIIRNNMLLERLEKLKRAMRGKQYANGGYIVGNTYDVDEQEANRLKSLGYEFTIIG